MDNPVFEDGTTATVVPAPASPAPQPQMQHVHIRLVAESHKSEGSNMIETANYIDEYNIVNRIRKTTNVKLRALCYLMLHVLCYGYKY